MERIKPESFLEQIIQSNPGKPELIKKAYYFVQKCKVALHEYSSALRRTFSGFQYIIQNHPYSFEGLLASWDYAAVALMMSSGGEKETDESTYYTDSSKYNKPEELFVDLNKVRDNYDKSRFNPSDRKKIIVTVETAIQNEKAKQEKKYDDLKTKTESNNSKVQNEAKKQLKTMNDLKETVKIKRPKTQSEYKDIISKDIAKVFGNKFVSSNKKTTNSIPTA